jgi:protein-S-isoprenylcysteine O-methyltransferase Ste14
LAKQVVQNLAFLVLLGLLLFPAAGTLAWPQAWVLLAVFDGCTIAFGLWLQRFDPDLLAERMKSPVGTNQKPRDRAIMGIIGACFAGWFVFMAIDARRLGWSSTPLWAQALGAVLIMVTFCAWASVLRANRFAISTIRLQPERCQTVISTGPYAIVRHPMYAYVILSLLGVPLLLGSLWGIAGILLLMPLLALRILGEEAMLMSGLSGYRDYAGKVRFRLLPGVW